MMRAFGDGAMAALPYQVPKLAPQCREVGYLALGFCGVLAGDDVDRGAIRRFDSQAAARVCACGSGLGPFLILRPTPNQPATFSI
jgi:hypothetical protein